MVRITFHALTLSIMVVLLPFTALAHERQAFEIGDTTYLFVVGSQGEPVVVDDRTGVSLRVLEADPDDVGNSSAEGAAPVEGLEESLHVVVQANGEEREMELSPTFRDPGAYETLFFPTRATEFSYTFVGEINGTPVELPFTCMPGDHVMDGMEANENTVALSDGVTRVYQSGMFTCPQEKEPLGFPADSASVGTLQGEIDEVRQMHMAMMETPEEEPAPKSGFQQHIAFFIALLALLLSVFALLRGRSDTGSSATPGQKQSQNTPKSSSNSRKVKLQDTDNN